MHRSIRAVLAVTALTLSAASPAADVDVGVSIGISQPGVYGRIDIGRFPQPAVVVSQPVYVVKQPRRVEPVYLWVPPGHQKNWAKHCGRYNACGVPVYFVREDWYRSHVAPQPVYEERRGPPGHSQGHGHGRGRGHDD